jgi:hypothetical protein
VSESKNFNVQIRTVSNGYMVFPAYDMRNDTGGVQSSESTKVFESFDALVAHLRAYLPVYPVFQPPAPKRVRQS